MVKLHFRWTRLSAHSSVSILPLAKWFQEQCYFVSVHLSAYLLLIKKKEHPAYTFMMKEASTNTENENIQLFFSVRALPHCCGQNPHNPIIYPKSPPLLKAQYT